MGPHMKRLLGVLLVLELPESFVFTFTYSAETVLGDLPNQILWRGLVVGNLKASLGSLVLFQFLVNWLHPVRAWGEVEVCFVRGESEQESGLHEEGGSPLERLLGLRRDVFEDFV